MKKASAHPYSEPEITWLKQNRSQFQITELTQLFNAQFNLSISKSAINGVCKRLKIKAGGTGRYEKGNKPYNTGTKGIRHSQQTEFKKGNRPHNYVPVGTEVMKSIGYIAIKVADPKTWKFKHILIWEEKHGPVPKNHVVIFADGNRENFDEDNLVLLSRQELLQVSRNDYLKMPESLRPAVLNMSKLQVAISSKSKEIGA